MTRSLFFLLPLTLPILLTACATSTPDIASAPTTPTQWQYSNATAAARAVSATWWNDFGSAELDAAIERAHNDSLDIAAAIARVEQARAQAVIAGASLLPQVDAYADVGRDKTLKGERETSGRYDVGVQAQYEIDFWGRQRALRDVATAGLRATEFDRDTVQLSVTASVASAWLRSVGLRESGAIAMRNVQTAERILQAVEARQRAGVASTLELANQRGLVAAQKRQLVVVQQQIAASDIALAALLGKSVSEVAPVTSALAALRNPTIDAGVPSTLLLRRPDIASAEAKLAAANADIEAARAALFPQITLLAGVDAASTHHDDLFDQPVATVSAGLLAPIFNHGRLSAQRDLAAAYQQELVASYRAAIIAALADVETALNASANIEQQYVVQQEELSQAQQAATIAESRYRAGAEDLLVMLDAQRTLYAAQAQQAELQTARLLASVDLYRALGGGWSGL